MNVLTKLGPGACVISGVLSGGYYLMGHRVNAAARLAVEAFKKDFEASVPSGIVDIRPVKATIFDQKATVENFSVRIEESFRLSSQAIV
jgi:hypothetical protein